MKVIEEKSGNITIFSIEGRLDSHTSEEVESKIINAIAQGSKEIVLNFSKLDYISSAGIRALVHCHKEIEKQSGNIYLASVPKPIENVLYITGFLPYFQVFEDQNQAIAAVNKLGG